MKRAKSGITNRQNTKENNGATHRESSNGVFAFGKRQSEEQVPRHNTIIDKPRIPLPTHTRKILPGKY